MASTGGALKLRDRNAEVAAGSEVPLSVKARELQAFVDEQIKRCADASVTVTNKEVSAQRPARACASGSHPTS